MKTEFCFGVWSLLGCIVTLLGTYLPMHVCEDVCHASEVLRIATPALQDLDGK
jgi:hypothetical protein